MADAQIIKEKINGNLNEKESIEAIHKKIDASKELVMFLKGVRGSGRTTVLLAKEAKNFLNGEVNIYHHFEHAGFGVTSKDVGIDLIKHKFELEMATVFLRFIISNGILDKSTERIKDEVSELRKLFVSDINNFCCTGNFESDVKKQGYYTDYLVEEIRKIYKPKKLSFLVDRFDWMFNRSMEAQKCISDYFPLFDQVILTKDDENYSSKYPVIDVNYGTDKTVVKEIIRKYIDKLNEAKKVEDQLNMKEISEETFDYIVEIANGDIDVILWAIKNINNQNINEDLKMNVEAHAKSRKKIKLPEYLLPKYYI